jgi:hypothetical protein
MSIYVDWIKGKLEYNVFFCRMTWVHPCATAEHVHSVSATQKVERLRERGGALSLANVS